jgi:hypothetical protein
MNCYIYDLADLRVWAPTLFVALRAGTVLSKRRDRGQLEHTGTCRIKYNGKSYRIKYERKY